MPTLVACLPITVASHCTLIHSQFAVDKPIDYAVEGGAVWWIDPNIDQSKNYQKQPEYWIMPVTPPALIPGNASIIYDSNVSPYHYSDNSTLYSAPAWMKMITLSPPRQTSDVTITPPLDVLVLNTYGVPFRLGQQSGTIVVIPSMIRVLKDSTYSTRPDATKGQPVADPILVGDWATEQRGQRVDRDGHIRSSTAPLRIVGVPGSMTTYYIEVEAVHRLSSQMFNIELRSCIAGESTSRSSCDACQPVRKKKKKEPYLHK